MHPHISIKNGFYSCNTIIVGYGVMHIILTYTFSSSVPDDLHTCTVYVYMYIHNVYVHMYMYICTCR